MIESFCMHARALEEFFDDSGKNTATSLSDGKYKAENKMLDDWTKKLNMQAAHIKFGRTMVDAEKLQETEWKEILRWIDARLKEFNRAMDGKGFDVRNVETGLIQ